MGRRTESKRQGTVRRTHALRGETTVELWPVEVRRVGGPVSWLSADAKLPEVVKAKAGELKKARRFYVFGRRTSTLEDAARKYAEATGEKPILVTGVEHPEYVGKEALKRRRREGPLPLFGNFSVEIGLDLQNVNYAIVSAGSLGELIQRMGRVGRRGSNSKVVVLVPAHYHAELVDRLGGKLISMEEFQKTLGLFMDRELLPSRLLSRRILEMNIGRAKIYLTTGLAVLSVLAAGEKLADTAVSKMLSRYLHILKVTGAETVRTWLAGRVVHTPEILQHLASFRSTWTIRYRRGGIEGEASLTTVLTNYTITRVGRGTVELGDPERGRVGDILTLEILAQPPCWLIDAVAPAWLVAEVLRVDIHSSNPSHRTLAQLLKKSNAPVYVAQPDDPYMYRLMNSYGYAIALKPPGDHDPVAYLVLL